jgi:protein-S-isoprenylcysteine O-methyltransferase Ste14
MRDRSAPSAALTRALARRRVPLGFAAAVVVVFLARPTWETWVGGLAVALVGEAVRIWAAGHVEKSREVTQSGPYRWTRHPLYAGSILMALGVIIAARHPAVAIVTGVYMAATLTAAIRSEEAFLRRTFGDAYDRYSASAAAPMTRRFSLARARRNREHRAVAGLFAGFTLLALKLLL